MENFVPGNLHLKALTSERYILNLQRLAVSGHLNAISFTGGEPTLNPDLGEIVEGARPFYRRVELTTNGRLLDRHMAQMAPHLDLLKVSLDGSTSERANVLSQGRGDNFRRAIDAVGMGLACGLNVAINVVAMRRTTDDLEAILDLARELGKNDPGRLYVSVLDLYYAPETRDVWKSDFVPLSDLADSLMRKFGPGQTQDRKGCGIDWWDDNGVLIRLKDSYSGTYRAPKCVACPVFCQEGFYGLKHSLEGWVTGCPSDSPELGVWLDPNLSNEAAQTLLAPLQRDLDLTRLDNDSFNTFLQVNGLAIDTGFQ